MTGVWVLDEGVPAGHIALVFTEKHFLFRLVLLLLPRNEEKEFFSKVVLLLIFLAEVDIAQHLGLLSADVSKPRRLFAGAFVSFFVVFFVIIFPILFDVIFVEVPKLVLLFRSFATFLLLLFVPTGELRQTDVFQLFVVEKPFAVAFDDVLTFLDWGFFSSNSSKSAIDFSMTVRSSLLEVATKIVARLFCCMGSWRTFQAASCSEISTVLPRSDDSWSSLSYG